MPIINFNSDEIKSNLTLYKLRINAKIIDALESTRNNYNKHLESQDSSLLNPPTLDSLLERLNLIHKLNNDYYTLLSAVHKAYYRFYPIAKIAAWWGGEQINFKRFPALEILKKQIIREKNSLAASILDSFEEQKGHPKFFQAYKALLVINEPESIKYLNKFKVNLFISNIKSQIGAESAKLHTIGFDGDRPIIVPNSFPLVKLKFYERNKGLRIAKDITISLFGYFSALNSVNKSDYASELKSYQNIDNKLARFVSYTQRTLGFPWRLFSNRNRLLNAYQKSIKPIVSKHHNELAKRYKALLEEMIDLFNINYPVTYFALLKSHEKFRKGVELLGYLKMKIGNNNPAIEQYESVWESIRNVEVTAFSSRESDVNGFFDNVHVDIDRLENSLSDENYKTTTVINNYIEALKAISELRNGKVIEGPIDLIIKRLNPEEGLWYKRLAHIAMQSGISFLTNNLNENQPALAKNIIKIEDERINAILKSNKPDFLFDALNWINDVTVSSNKISNNERLRSILNTFAQNVSQRIESQCDPALIALRKDIKLRLKTNDILEEILKKKEVLPFSIDTIKNNFDKINLYGLNNRTIPSLYSQESLSETNKQVSPVDSPNSQSEARSNPGSISSGSSSPERGKSPVFFSAPSVGYEMLTEMVETFDDDYSDPAAFLLPLNLLKQVKNEAPARLKPLSDKLDTALNRLNSRKTITELDEALKDRLVTLIAFLNNSAAVNLDSIPNTTDNAKCIEILSNHYKIPSKAIASCYIK